MLLFVLFVVVVVVVVFIIVIVIVFDFATITGTSITLSATLTAANVISYNIDYTGTIYIGQNSATMIEFRQLI